MRIANDSREVNMNTRIERGSFRIAGAEADKGVWNGGGVADLKRGQALSRRRLGKRLGIVLVLAGLLAACSEGMEAGGEKSVDGGDGAGALHMVMHHDADCGCCGDWAVYMQEQGFHVEARPATNIVLTRRQLGVPDALASCHTAEIDGYLVEGHVPADAVRRLLAERPDAVGISAPGMPWGSPGMEIGERVDVYPVVLFEDDGKQTLYARYRGHERVEQPRAAPSD